MAEEMSVVENKSEKSSKENCINKKKRKFIQTVNENGLNSHFGEPRVWKKPRISKSSQQDIPKFLQYKSTNDYTQIVAEPSLLPSTPKIFKTNKLKNDSIFTSDSFLFNLLSSNLFDTNKSERFTQVENNKTKCKNEIKKKVKKVKKESKEEEEKVERSIKNGEKVEKSVENKEEFERKVKNGEKVEKSVENKEEFERKVKNGEKVEKSVENEKEVERRVKNGEKVEKSVENEKEVERRVKNGEKVEKSVENEKEVERRVKNGEKLEKSVENEENEEKKKIIKKNIESQSQQSYEKTENSIIKENENMAHKIYIYRVPEKEILIFYMCHPSKFSFQGELKITIISGEVEVLGYSLNSLSNRNSVDIYSPNFCIPLIVETKLAKQTKPLEEVLLKLKENMTEHDYDTCSKHLKPEDSIIFVELLKSSFGNVINKYFDLPVFPKDLEEFFLMTKTLKTVQSIFNFNFSITGKHFRKSSQWDKIPLGQCTVLCGGRGVGKSTLLKYYLNKCTALEEKVLCLDFDPGQPEFTFPGCISAVVVDEPLIGPNFTHVKDPILMMNYGDVDVNPNPTKYLECVKYIIDYCRKNEELLKMKWFVNTMGFCKGLGVSLIISILKLIKPDTVIQIKGSDFKNNYPFYLTSVTLNSKYGFRSMPLGDVTLSHDLRVIYSCAELNRKQIKGGLKQRQLRDIMGISYFSKAVSPPFYNFNAVQPYLISFSQLYLGIDFYIDPNEVLKAFNGNTVSLSHFEPDTEEIFSVQSEEDDYYKVVINPRIAPSLGIGFVRGIDCKEKKFYVLTHLSLEILEKVNCLELRRICAPHSMFLKQDSVVGQTFYTTSGTTDIIHRVKRMFRVPDNFH